VSSVKIEFENGKIVDVWQGTCWPINRGRRGQAPPSHRDEHFITFCGDLIGPGASIKVDGPPYTCCARLGNTIYYWVSDTPCT
jgi:hypothetical protein